MYKTELKKRCKELGLQGYSNLRKSELQALLTNLHEKKELVKLQLPNPDDYLSKGQLQRYRKWQRQRASDRTMKHKYEEDFMSAGSRRRYNLAKDDYNQREYERNEAIVKFTLIVGLNPYENPTEDPEQLRKLFEELADAAKESDAWRIVRSSYKYVGKVLSEEYLGSGKVRVLLRLHEKDPVWYVTGFYTDAAADTWMEGDIQFDHDHEVSLHLVGPVIKIF
jgi:hypothetical protein